MAVIGTFGSFTTARLGIYASQASLQVTGNNIANINTTGYTRQRADLISLYSTGTAKYYNPMSVDIGYGVLVNQVSQLRDPYLDIRFRNENTKLGAYNATMEGLTKLSQTLDEVNKGGEPQNGIIENALMNFQSMLEALSDRVGSEEYDGLVREAAKSLTTFFNTAADKLQNDWDLQADELRDTVKDVNACLTKIRDLNEQIRKQGIYGDNALELRDHRNLEIDKLSGYMGINVEYSMERIDQYTEVEKLTITLKDTKDPRTGQPIKLIDGLYGSQISLSEVEVNPKYNANGDAYVLGNGLYNPNTPAGTAASYRYLRADGTGTNNIGEALSIFKNPKAGQAGQADYLDKDGNPVNVPHGTPVDVSGKPYLNAQGEPVENLEDAAPVDPNKFLFQVERLEDKFGRPLDRDRQTESVVVPLSDTDLTGSLQAMRELLTEEGEFASRKDVGSDTEMSYSDLRAMDPNANIKKGMPYYQKRLDLLAQKFAEVFNEANQLPASTVYVTQARAAGALTAGTDLIMNRDGTTDFHLSDGTEVEIKLDDVTVEVPVLDANGKPVDPAEKERIPIMDTQRVRDALADQIKAEGTLTDPEEIAQEVDRRIAYSADCLAALRNEGQLKEEYEFYDGGVLFSNSGNNNDPSNITARNISIANGWAARVVRVLNTKRPDTPAIPDDPDTPDVDESRPANKHSSRSDNILHMISLFEQQLTYTAQELEPDAAGGSLTFFHGSFQEMYTDLGATLGSELSTIQGVTANYELTTLDMDNKRISVSGVDLNDEATNMMQFQKSYQAACRLLTTIDSMLDTLINNTIR